MIGLVNFMFVIVIVNTGPQAYSDSAGMANKVLHQLSVTLSDDICYEKILFWTKKLSQYPEECHYNSYHCKQVGL